MTAYFMWLNDNRARIVAELAGKAGPDVTKKGSEEWKALLEEEKKPYEDRATKAKEDYDAFIATEEGAAALNAYKEATAAVAYKPTLATPEKKRESPVGSQGTTAAKKSRKSTAVASPSVVIDAVVLAEAEKGGLRAALENLAARSEIVSREVKGLDLLKALKQSGGLVNKAKAAILGA